MMYKIDDKQDGLKCDAVIYDEITQFVDGRTRKIIDLVREKCKKQQVDFSRRK
ncbi:hypothetical protein BCJMU07_4275 [Bacillus cereus]|nr:hypothetical protein BCJMU07_4275 [Bacillus cereus]BCC78687.1 hypothetical protein BCJMU62_4378 [Bacillus cereus]